MPRQELTKSSIGVGVFLRSVETRRRSNLFEYNLVQVRTQIRAGFGIEKPSEFVIADLAPWPHGLSVR